MLMSVVFRRQSPSRLKLSEEWAVAYHIFHQLSPTTIATKILTSSNVARGVPPANPRARCACYLRRPLRTRLVLRFALMSLDDVNQIVLTARISFAEWWRLGIVAVFGSQVRLRVITRFTATLWMHRGFETQAILRLVDIEVTALIQVMLALSVTQTDPPFVARGIYRFSSRPRQRRARLPRDLRIVGKRDDQRAASPQRVFIDEQLIARDSISDTLFKRLACQNACRGATHAKNRRADQTKCEYG